MGSYPIHVGSNPAPASNIIGLHGRKANTQLRFRKESQKMKVRSPLVWLGGKARMVPKIIPLIPKHRIFVEVFGGGMSLLLAHGPSEIEVYNDLDSGLVNFFRVIRDPDKFGRFYHYAIYTPYSREEFLFCRDSWDKSPDEVIKAYRWYIKNRFSFGGMCRSWGRTVTSSSRGMTEAASSWIGILYDLPEIHRRIMRVQIENKDFRAILKDYDTPDTFFYCDPPYIPETRRDGKYAHELTAADHRELVEMLLALKGAAILSGYAHPLYQPLEAAGWERQDYELSCRVTGRTKDSRHMTKEQLKRVESLWISPKCKEH
jgi:DNA adenine methylase